MDIHEAVSQVPGAFQPLGPSPAWRPERRIFNRQERRYLSREAQSMAYCLLCSQSVPPDVTENAIQQAVTLGAISGAVVDAQTFETLFRVVTLNPSFRIPFAAELSMTPFSSWVC